MAQKLTLSISVTKGRDDKYIHIHLISFATWNVRRSFLELDELHTLLSQTNRGIFLPALPNVSTSTSAEYQEYLSKVICRTFWVHLEAVLTFIQAPLEFRRAVSAQYTNEKSTVIKCGKLKKEGQKNKSYHKRYFVVLSNYLITYFDSKQAFNLYTESKNNKPPKGHIDLLLVKKLITPQNTNKKYAFHLSTPTRLWKLQCKSQSEQNEWVQFLANYLSSKKYQAFIAPHRPNQTEVKCNNEPEDIQELFLSKNTKHSDPVNRIAHILLYHYQLTKAMDYKKGDELYVHNTNDDEKSVTVTQLEANQILYNYINQQLYPYNNVRLLNDYFLLILNHSGDEFNMLYGRMTNKIGTFCDIQLCSSFERIEKDAINNINTYYNYLNSSHKELDILHLCDMIHCYFLHGYDVGMKLSDKELSEIENCISESKQDDNVTNRTEIFNMQFDMIKQLLLSKRKEFQTRLNFASTHYGSHQVNKFITHCIETETKADNLSTSFGYKYFYWNSYRHNDEDDLKYNIGHKINDFYIVPKHKDIKSEIFGNGQHLNNIFCIGQKKWDYLLRRALLLLRCDVVKKLRANNIGMDSNIAIAPGDVITVSHILAILIYTNIIVLQRDLTSTYNKNTTHESLQSMKKRHCRYGNWAKYLFESIHLYGTELICNKEKDAVFYHGIDSLIYFTDNIINFNYPMSCSSSLIVTTSYCYSYSDGLIVKLIKSDTVYPEFSGTLQYFNCAIFSDFAFEDECLFDGSWNTLHIDSIFHVSLSRKYRTHLRSLKIIDLMFTGVWMRTSLPPTTRKIITMLFTNELTNWLGFTDNEVILPEFIYKLPEYVELSFHCFVHKIQSLVIDVASMMIKKQSVDGNDYFGYSWLRRFIIYQKLYFVNLSVLIPLFPKCKTLQILNSVHMGATSLKFEFSEQILKIFLKLFNSAQFKHSQSALKQIQMSGFETKSSKIKKLCAHYFELFKQTKWHLQCIEIEETNQILIVMQCIRKT